MRASAFAELELMERQAESRASWPRSRRSVRLSGSADPARPVGVRLEAADRKEHARQGGGARSVCRSTGAWQVGGADPPRCRPACGTRFALQALRSRLALGRAGEKNAGAIPALLRRFELAARSNQTLGAQKMQIAAIRAYNKRVRSLDDIAIRIHRERARLQQILA
jgi:hypothetical protein